jgi:hypothetical protein
MNMYYYVLEGSYQCDPYFEDNVQLQGIIWSDSIEEATKELMKFYGATLETTTMTISENMPALERMVVQTSITKI